MRGLICSKFQIKPAWTLAYETLEVKLRLRIWWNCKKQAGKKTAYTQQIVVLAKEIMNVWEADKSKHLPRDRLKRMNRI